PALGRAAKLELDEQVVHARDAGRARQPERARELGRVVRRVEQGLVGRLLGEEVPAVEDARRAAAAAARLADEAAAEERVVEARLRHVQLETRAADRAPTLHLVERQVHAGVAQRGERPLETVAAHRALELALTAAGPEQECAQRALGPGVDQLARAAEKALLALGEALAQPVARRRLVERRPQVGKV